MFRSYYNDYKDQWHVGFFLSGIIISTIISPIMGWYFWADELRYGSDEALSARASKSVAAFLAGESKAERRIRNDRALTEREKRILELEKELELDAGE